MSEQRDSTGQELGFLEKLSIEDLEALLKTSGNPNDVETFFDAVIKEVVQREKKEPTGRLPDVDAAWEEIQTRCNTLDRLAQKEYKDEESTNFILKNLEAALREHNSAVIPQRTAHRILHTFAIIALSIVLTFAAMVGAQAAGMNVFGALAHFTENTFRFITDPSPRNEVIKYHDEFRDSIDVIAALGSYAPAWRPKGAEATGSKRQEDEIGIYTEVFFTLPDDGYFCIRIDKYKNGEDINTKVFERDTTVLDEHTGNLGKYYIYSNEGNLVATASNGTTVQTIWGTLSVDELKLVIDSIGGS